MSLERPLLAATLGLSLVGLTIWQGARLAACTSTVQAMNATARVSSSSVARRVRAEGRLAAYPGAEVAIGFDLGGTALGVLVQERARVRAGEVLATLDSAEHEASLLEARANLAGAEATVAYLSSELARIERLAGSAVATEQELARARFDADAARARFVAASAQVRRLEAVLAKTRLASPIDGVVIGRFVHPGEAVVPGTRAFLVADLTRVRVVAEVDEFDAGEVRVGAPVLVEAEGYRGKSWRGRVEEIPDAVQARQVRPQDPGRPTDTRVILVKIALEEGTPLKLGQRVEVSIGDLTGQRPLERE